MSGTCLFYNGVLLRDCETKQWRQEIVRDESDTDVLYSKVTLSVESTLVSVDPLQSGINAPRSTIAVPALTDETVVDRWQEIQWRLQETRKDFWLALNSTTAIQSTGSTVPANDGSTNQAYRVVLAATGLTAANVKDFQDDPAADMGFIESFNDFGLGTPRTKVERSKVIDLNGGPKPREVVVEKIFGGRALRVSFTIEICRCFCKPVGSTGNPDDVSPPVLGAGKVEGVISNRWSLSETLDADWKTEHVISGKLIVSDARYRSHAMRLVVQPKLFPYAKLESRNFATDKTGLVLDYRFQIKETGPAAPLGVVDWHGTYSERSTNGGKKLADVAVRVTGSVNPVLGADAPSDPGREHKVKLLAIAYRIARARILWSTKHDPEAGKTPQTTLLVDMIVVEQMEKPIIELRVSVLYADKGQAGGLVSDNFGLRLESLGKSLEEQMQGFDNDYDPRWWRGPTAFPWDTDSETAASTEQDIGTYYDVYYQSPCSTWHAMPEGAIPPESTQRDEQNPVIDTYSVDPNLTASLDDPNDPPPGSMIPSANHGWADGQVDFGYFQADIDTRYELASGKVQLPLSKPQQYSSGSFPRSCVVVSLHSGLAKRIITMVATRQGKWPQVPAPQSLVQNNNIVETFLDGQIIHDAPKLNKDGKTYMYSSQIRWEYALNRLPNQASDVLRAASNPMDKTTPSMNQIRITDYFTYNEVEYGQSGSTLIS